MPDYVAHAVVRRFLTDDAEWLTVVENVLRQDYETCRRRLPTLPAWSLELLWKDEEPPSEGDEGWSWKVHVDA